MISLTGAAMFAPWINPYESSMSKEERSGTWKNWTRKRKFLYYLARRFPKFLGYLYRQTFLSGKHGQINKWLSLSLGKKASSFRQLHTGCIHRLLTLYNCKLNRITVAWQEMHLLRARFRLFC